jgi:hypothetical protein
MQRTLPSFLKIRQEANYPCSCMRLTLMYKKRKKWDGPPTSLLHAPSPSPSFFLFAPAHLDLGTITYYYSGRGIYIYIYKKFHFISFLKQLKQAVKM